MALTEVNSLGIKDLEVKTGDIANLAVTDAKIAAGTITGSKIANDAINGNHLGDDVIQSEHYADGSIDTAHIADDQITLAKMAAGTDGQIITYDANGDPVAVGPGTDGQVLTSTGAGSPPAFEDVPAGGATINNATANELVTVASTTTQLDAEANLTFDGHHLTQNIDANAEGFNQTAAGAHYIDNTAEANLSSGDNPILRTTATWNGKMVAMIKYNAGTDTTNKDDGYLTFNTSAANDLSERMRITSSGTVGIGETVPLGQLHVKTGDSGQGTLVNHGDDFCVEGSGDSGLTILSGATSDGSVIFGDSGDADVGRIAYNHNNNHMQFDTSGAERFRIDDAGASIWRYGHLGSFGGGVVVAAAVSSSGDSADSPNFKVDFTVPCGNVSQNYGPELQRGFSTGETGKAAECNIGGSGILVATCLGSYYWGFATKIYHLTSYGNGSSTASSLNEIGSYSGQGHSSSAAHVSLAVQSIDHSTPTVRATFGGDYWNSNRLSVVWIGAMAVSSPSMIRPNAMTDTNWGHAKWTGQDPTWK